MRKKISMLLVVTFLMSLIFTQGVFASETYTVKEGDVLWKIADQLGVQWEDLADYNDLENPDLLHVGDELMVPGPGLPALSFESLTILHTNDMHGFFVEGKYDGMGAGKLGSFFTQMRQANENVLVLDAGDASQGANLVTLSEGENAFEILNALGYDAMVAGNHEFDYGKDQLLENVAQADFPVLAANIKTQEGEDFLPPYVIQDVNGIKVALLGLATPETSYKSHPDNTVGLTFEDPLAVAEEYLPMLEEEADVVVALVHLGDEGDYSSDALAQVDGIDLIIDGHSHSTYEQGSLVDGTYIASAGDKTKNVGVVKIQLLNKEVQSVDPYLFTKEQSLLLEDHPDIAALVASIQAENAVIENEVVSQAPYELLGEREDVRTGETNLGNLITASLKQVSGADLALTNGGGIRTSIAAGEVTKGDVLTVLPFGNTVRVIELSGADVIEAIENGVSNYPEPAGHFPHIAGMTVTFDSSQEVGSKVVSVMVDGQAIDEEAMYTLATNDYLVAGGDGYTMFTDKKVVAEYGAMDEVLIDYLNEYGFDASDLTDRIQDLSETSSVLEDLSDAA